MNALMTIRRVRQAGAMISILLLLLFEPGQDETIHGRAHGVHVPHLRQRRVGEWKERPILTVLIRHDHFRTCRVGRRGRRGGVDHGAQHHDQFDSGSESHTSFSKREPAYRFGIPMTRLKIGSVPTVEILSALHGIVALVPPLAPALSPLRGEGARGTRVVNPTRAAAFAKFNVLTAQVDRSRQRTLYFEDRSSCPLSPQRGGPG
jgi:hypothetical protein